MFFSLSSWELGFLIFAVVGGASALGVLAGRYMRAHSDRYRESIGALQGALLGVVGLILAFGLSLAVGRYQDRRADVVTDANTIGTAYLRAQTIAEPQRSRSLPLLRSYNDLAIRITYEIPGSAAIHATAAEQGELQRHLWRLAGESLDARPLDSAPRLYVDSLNDMIDQQTVRLAGLNNRVPDAVLWLELLGAAVALGLLALYLSVLGKGLIPIVAAAGIVELPRARHLRPRPPDAGPYRDPSHAPSGREGRDELAARRHGTPLKTETAPSPSPGAEPTISGHQDRVRRDDRGTGWTRPHSKPKSGGSTTTTVAAHTAKTGR